jgi:hypothetical protein
MFYTKTQYIYDYFSCQGYHGNVSYQNYQCSCTCHGYQGLLVPMVTVT